MSTDGYISDIGCNRLDEDQQWNELFVQRVYGFSVGCARERIECQKLRKIGQIFGVPINHFSTIVVPQRAPFLWICVSEGRDLGQNFVLPRVGFHKFYASEGRSFAVPS